MASLTSLKTPGVYVQEVDAFPPSVAQVPTAIPAFIGYTEIAVNNGKDLTNIPTLIGSLLDYTKYFGGEYDLQWTQTASGQAPVASTWHYLVFTYDGTNNDIYVDGQLAISEPVPTTGGGNGQLNTFAGFPVNLAAQNSSTNSGTNSGTDTGTNSSTTPPASS